jgi:hypothetical protein
MKRKAALRKAALFTPEQIELGAKYLAMSNMCTLDHHRKGIKDLATLKSAVQRAWEDAVTGSMECEEGGYDDRNESKAIDGVEAEIQSFRKDLRSPTKSKYWFEKLTKEIPYLFAVQS